MDFPVRKNTRLQGYDYTAPGAYFVTVCTEKRANILSHIVGEGSPLPQLSPYGQIADRVICEISKKYKTCTVDRYVIMPNHIHLLLRFDGRGNPAPTISDVVGWMKYEITKQINGYRGAAGEKVFQRSFHDHIIRGETDYLEIWQYIDNNPLKWEEDCFYAK